MRIYSYEGPREASGRVLRQINDPATIALLFCCKPCSSFIRWGSLLFVWRNQSDRESSRISSEPLPLYVRTHLGPPEEGYVVGPLVRRSR